MTIVFSFPEQTDLCQALLQQGQWEQGEWEWRHFPDHESYIRVKSAVQSKPVAILCSLNSPDTKIMSIIFLSQTLKELGATHITLIAPYLGYMRQDKRFQDGEAITSDIFAKLLSPYIRRLITIDPHLHRHKRLEEIYNCACTVLTAAPLMAAWIAAHVPNPLIIGPDMESEQWVANVAQRAKAPYIILEKTRHGDRDVEILLPDATPHKKRTPVLVDDIISTGSTLIKAIGLLQQQGFTHSICMATHGLFSDADYQRLQQTGTHIVTSNTISHPTNAIDIAPLLKASFNA